MTEPQEDRNLAEQFIESGDPTGWFEQLYANAQGDETRVPWENGAPHPTFVEWRDRTRFLAEPGQTALVVACGLGSDAEELARLGFTVTAFDISPTAIAWCQARFPDSSVDYQVADLFKAPEAWQQAFDFVLDIYTIQALPPAMHPQTAKAIAGFVAPGGRLFNSYMARKPDVPPVGPPWPLAKAELDLMLTFGLYEISFEDYFDLAEVHRFRAVYGRAA